MSSQTGSGPTQDGFALDDQRRVIADIDARAMPAQEPPTSAYDFDVSHDRELHHYDAILNGYEIGRLDYTLTGDRIVLASMVILSSFQHHGIATERIRRVLDDVRTTGKTITVLCPIVRAFIDRYLQYADLINRARPGVPSNT